MSVEVSSMTCGMYEISRLPQTGSTKEVFTNFIKSSEEEVYEGLYDEDIIADGDSVAFQLVTSYMDGYDETVKPWLEEMGYTLALEWVNGKTDNTNYLYVKGNT